MNKKNKIIKRVTLYLVLAIILCFIGNFIHKLCLISPSANVYYSALNYYHSNQLNKSVQVCNNFLNNRNNKINYQNLTVSKCYELTAEFYCQNKDYKKAEIYFKNASKMSFNIKTLKIPILEKEAKCFMKQNKYNKSEQLLKKIIEIYSNIKEWDYSLEDKLNHVSIYLQYGLLESKKQNYNLAIKYFNKSIYLYNKYKLKNENYIYLIKSYNGLAQTYIKRKEYNLAKNYLKKAICIKSNNLSVKIEQKKSQSMLNAL